MQRNVQKNTPSGFDCKIEAKLSKFKLDSLDIDDIIQQLKKSGFLSRQSLHSIICSCTKTFSHLPNLISVSSPILVVGDIHGQFYDLLNIFQKFGEASTTQYLFMGDYVDRGLFCIEVITLLLCLKLKYPQQVHMLRGNHESRLLTSNFNFREQCCKKYDQEVYLQFMELFDQLPIGALIDSRYFCVHAGISPDLRSISDIQKTNRFREPPEKGGVCDLLWSDPVDGVIDKWMPNKNRMCSYFYGVLQAKNFLDKNKLKLIIRGHQVENSGYKYQKNFINDKPVTLTIFSAPNYCDLYRNKGAVLMVSGEKLNIFSFSEVDHPIVLPKYMNIIEWTMPFLAEEVTKIFKAMLKFEKTHEKKKKAEKILQSEKNFQQEMEVMRRLELIERVISQKKLKHQEDILKQSLKALCQYSKKQFINLKNTDNGEKYPQNDNSGVIGPKLHGSFKKIGSVRSIEDEDDSVNDDLDPEFGTNLTITGTSAKIPTLNIL